MSFASKFDNTLTVPPDPPKLTTAVSTTVAQLVCANSDERAEMLANMSPESRKLALSALDSTETLVGLTGWSAEDVIARLRCNGYENWESRDPDELHERLEQSDRMLRVIRDLAQLVDTGVDRRSVVIECDRLIWKSRPQAEQLEAVFVPDSLPHVYVSLGEIAAAGIAAEEMLAPTDSGEDLFADARLVHLSQPRIKLFLERRRDLLGEESVYERISEHVLNCKPCRDEFTALRSMRAAQR